MKRRYCAVALLMALAAALAFAWLLPQLPERVPVHWNARGQVDRYGSPWVLFMVGPVLMLALTGMFAALPWLSPRRFEVEAFERTYLNVMLLVVGICGYVFLVALWSGAQGPVGVLEAVTGGLCVFHILVGNMLGKIRRNFFLGIRTPWTLASERVWYATHRMGAKVVVATGVVALVLLVAGVPAVAVIVLLVGAFFVPAAYSLVYYKRLERNGGLGASGT